jgi:phosphohistidine phosphatase SixA
MKTGKWILEYIFTLRHGEAEYINVTDKRLTKKGIAENQSLAAKLKALIGGRKAVVICSHANRAVLTAMMVCKELGINRPRVDEILFSCDMPAESQLLEIMNLVTDLAHKFEVIIFISHDEIVEAFPEYLVAKKFNKRSKSIPAETSCGWQTTIKNEGGQKEANNMFFDWRMDQKTEEINRKE